MLRGLQAVASRGHRYGVRVVNLSLSSDSPAQVADDPLVLALDRLWHAGITVVLPAGNGGPAPGSVASPGIDPTLLTPAQSTPWTPSSGATTWSRPGQAAVTVPTTWPSLTWSPRERTWSACATPAV